MAADQVRSNILEFYGVLKGSVEKWQYVWNTETDIIHVNKWKTPRLDEFDGNLFTSEVVGDWIAIACSDCSSPFVNFYNRDEFTLTKAFKMTDTYGQTKFSLAWYKNDFNAIKVLVASSAKIDMIEIYTPPRPAEPKKNEKPLTFDSRAWRTTSTVPSLWNFNDNIFSQDKSFIEGY